MNISRQKHIRGFSLVEMVVSLMIFSVVAVIALGAMIKIESVNKKAQTLMSSITNINFALDIMSRELSLASAVGCETIGSDQNPPASLAPFSSISCNNVSFTGGKSVILVFQTPNPGASCGVGQTLSDAYFFHVYPSNTTSFTLEKSEQTDCGQNFGDPSAPFVYVTAPEVTLTNFMVNVNYDSVTQKYPLTFLHLSGFAGANELEKTYFDVQTAISLAKPQ